MSYLNINKLFCKFQSAYQNDHSCRHDPEWIPSKMDTFSNGHIPKWTPSQMDTILNGHHPEWTQSRTDTISNEHLHLYSCLWCFIVIAWLDLFYKNEDLNKN